MILNLHKEKLIKLLGVQTPEQFVDHNWDAMTGSPFPTPLRFFYPSTLIDLLLGKRHVGHEVYFS